MVTKHTYYCSRVHTPPVIDGHMQEESWRNAPIIPFVRSETGEPALKPTFARMCWDEKHLYVAFDCHDTDIHATLLRRDDPIYTEDVVEVFLCPDNDLTHYYELEVSPRNVLFDAEVTTENELGDGMRADVAWDCRGWRTAVSINGTLNDRTDIDTGWKVEMAIPFAAISRRKPRHGEKWRANLYRIDRSPEPVEHQAWSPTYADPANFHKPFQFGVIEFVER